eukprot:753975-Hanusia_phi.AAC.5
MGQEHASDCRLQIFEGELFDFDFEVEPILQVIVGKTLEQSLMEVLEEEELKNMRAHQEEFDQIRAAELAEAQVISLARPVLSGPAFLTVCRRGWRLRRSGVRRRSRGVLSRREKDWRTRGQCRRRSLQEDSLIDTSETWCRRFLGTWRKQASSTIPSSRRSRTTSCPGCSVESRPGD